jgi:DNA-directed RNA polymerase specialized sigma24 family protein
MRNLTSLNNLYQTYQEGNLGKRDFEGEMFRVLLENLPYFRLFDGDEEESIDYLCWLYPRLSRAIHNYRDNGAAFSTYISTLVRCSTKEYRSRQIDHYITEYAAWAAHTADLEAHSPAPEYLKYEEEEGSSRFQGIPLIKSRQIILLILRSYFFISDDFLEKIAPFTGIKKEKIIEMIEKLRDIRSDRDEEIRQFRERIATQFYRCVTWEKRLKILFPGSAYYGKIQERLERAKKRLARMRRRFARFKVDATHRQIAEVMGLSAGTVSSSLFSLKNHWETDQDGQLVSKAKREGNAGQGK